MALVNTTTETIALRPLSSLSLRAEPEFHVSSRPSNGDLPNEQNEEAAPDGGKEALLVLLGCSCTGYAGLALLNCPGSLQAWISQHELPNESVARLGWIFGFYTFMSFFCGIQTGPIFDAYGPRGLILVGSCLLVATYLILGLCRSYWQFFLTLGVLGGLSTSILITCTIGTVQLWYFRHRGIATAIALCGGAISGITFPLLLEKLLPEIGFSWTLRAVALLIFPFLTIGCLLTKRRRKRIHTHNGTGSSHRLSMRGLLFDPRILLAPDIAVATFGVFFLEWGLFIVLSYISSYALRQNISFSIAYHLLSYLNAASLVGRLISGYVGDVIGRFNTQIISTSLCTISILCMWWPAGDSSGLVIAFSVLFGLGCGSTLSLTPVCLGQLCEVERYGRTYTAVYTVSSIG